MEQFPFYLILVLVIVLLMMAAKKIRVAYPVLLVLAGLAISVVPGIPMVRIDPELIFIIFLPPLLYEAAWAISWKELWHWRRIIGSFAFVVVLFSALAVAIVANYFIPGFSLALGFLLGGIVSPPDAVSAGAILKFVKVPKRLTSILEGESLLNDASSLIIFRFAMIAVATGQFIWGDVLMSFGWMLAGGVLIGLAIAWVFMKAHKHLPTDANIDIVLSIVTPYIMYLVAEDLHSSGVLAVVSGGLFLSTHRHHFLSSSSLLKGGNVWESLCFVLNGLVFILIGLQLPDIVAGLGDVSLSAAIGYGVLVTVVLIAGRMISAYGAVITTLIMRNFITVADTRHPGYKAPILLGWAGMRGVVSLAAALSIPVHMANGALFPQRNLILFITFVVILLTLLVQGLSLPYLIRKINMPDPDLLRPEEEVDHELGRRVAEHALAHLGSRYAEELASHPAIQQMAAKLQNARRMTEDDQMSEEFKHICRDLLEQQRQWLIAHNKADKTVDEELIRKHLARIDLEEEKLRYM